MARLGRKGNDFRPFVFPLKSDTMDKKGEFMLQQLKKDRIAQAMLVAVVLVGCLACGIWGVWIFDLTRITVPANAPIAVAPKPTQTRAPTNTPRPIDTPAPTPTRSGIQVDRQDLVDRFDRKGFQWREATYKDGTHQLTGEAQSGTGKIVMWSTPDDPEDLIELFYSFTVPFEGGGTSREDIQEMFNLAQVIFPDWDGGSQWIINTIETKGGETQVNGITVSFEWGDEKETEQTVYIFSIVE